MYVIIVKYLPAQH